MSAITLQTTIDEKQLISLLNQLSSKEKLKIAALLRAQVATEQWRSMSNQMPNIEDISMEEIIEEVKSVRNARS